MDDVPTQPLVNDVQTAPLIQSSPPHTPPRSSPFSTPSNSAILNARTTPQTPPVSPTNHNHTHSSDPNPQDNSDLPLDPFIVQWMHAIRCAVATIATCSNERLVGCPDDLRLFLRYRCSHITKNTSATTADQAIITPQNIPDTTSNASNVSNASDDPNRILIPHKPGPNTAFHHYPRLNNWPYLVHNSDADKKKQFPVRPYNSNFDIHVFHSPRKRSQDNRPILNGWKQPTKVILVLPKNAQLPQSFTATTIVISDSKSRSHSHLSASSAATNTSVTTSSTTRYESSPQNVIIEAKHYSEDLLFMENVEKHSIQNALATQIRRDFGVLNCIQDLIPIAQNIIDELTHQPSNYFNTPPFQPSTHLQNLNSNSLSSPSLSMTTTKEHYLKRYPLVHSYDIDVNNLPKLYFEKFSSNSGVSWNQQELPEFLSIVSRLCKCSKQAIVGVPGISNKYLFLRRFSSHNENNNDKNNYDYGSEDGGNHKIESEKKAYDINLNEAKEKLRNIKHHPQGGVVKLGIGWQAIAWMYTAFAIVISVTVYVANWGDQETNLEKLFDSISSVTYLLVSIFGLLRLRSEDPAFLHNWFFGKQVFYSVNDVKRYYLSHKCHYKSRYGIFGWMFRPLRWFRSKTSNSEIVKVPFDTALADTSQPLLWLSPEHASFLRATPSGSLVYADGVKTEHMKDLGVFTGKKIMLDFRTDSNNSSNGACFRTFAYGQKFVHKQEKLTAKDLEKILEKNEDEDGIWVGDKELNVRGPKRDKDSRGDYL